MVRDTAHKAAIMTDAEVEAEENRLLVIRSVRDVRRAQTMAGRRKNNPKAQKLFERELRKQLNPR